MAIQTTFAGIEYRSRLEAKWAAFFTLIGWQHTYEPFDGDGYIPDFLIHGDRPLLVEVKPAVTLRDYQAPTAKAENGLRDWNSDILIVGADPLPQLKSCGPNDQPAGLLGELIGEGIWEWDTAEWLTCNRCGQIGVLHSVQSYAGRPCGHHAGDHYIGIISRHYLTEAWATATNRVKWEGRAA